MTGTRRKPLIARTRRAAARTRKQRTPDIARTKRTTGRVRTQGRTIITARTRRTLARAATQLSPAMATAQRRLSRPPENQIFKNVKLGKNCTLEPPVIIGKPPRGKTDGELITTLGDNCVVRSFTTIYAGTRIGHGLQTGHGALIREGNVIGNGCSIGTNAVLEFDNKIGNFVRIHSGAFLEMVAVEDYVFIGPNVVFTDDPHPMACPKFKECVGGATVRKYARIGANSTVLPGVIIGRNALVGAGSVVVKDVEEGTVVAGAPAKVICRVSELKCRKGFFARPYEWEPYEEK